MYANTTNMVCINKFIYFLGFVVVMANMSMAWSSKQGDDGSLSASEENLALRQLFGEAFGKRRL